MAFAKTLLIIVIVLVVALALLMRVRAWRARRTAAKRAWQAEVDRAIRES
ncbi:hypothetical protein [Leucobacter luti]|nr:hypothetical protein [Leucobacter luti]MCW2287233.1 heme/copper-type cytochrome/quinol oxidase subunit 2 [Leucobacter luti]